jgi:hypothetical protein
MKVIDFFENLPSIQEQSPVPKGRAIIGSESFECAGNCYCECCDGDCECQSECVPTIVVSVQL